MRCVESTSLTEKDCKNYVIGEKCQLRKECQGLSSLGAGDFLKRGR